MRKISPEKYRKILAGIDLKNILLSDLKASVKHSALTENIKISIDDEASFENVNDELVITHKFKLRAGKSSKKTALKIEATFLLVFETQEEITEEFFNVYKEVSLPLNSWPFFRELVYSLTSRMNISPLTLPLLKR